MIEIENKEKQKPKLKLLGHDGNIFSIMGDASQLLWEQGQKKEISEMIQRVKQCDDYYAALGIISEYVETELSISQTPNKKYEITNIHHSKYPWLHRIRSLVKVNERVPAGTLGGFVEHENNLSQEGGCWIYDNAVCCEKAMVDRDASLFDTSMAREAALITGNARMHDRTLAEGQCCLRGGELQEDARIAGNAVISEGAIDGLAPLITGQSNVYGEVRGRFEIRDNILPKEELVNPTEDLFILNHGDRTVIVKQRELESPQRRRNQNSLETPDIPPKKKKQPER